LSSEKSSKNKILLSYYQKIGSAKRSSKVLAATLCISRSLNFAFTSLLHIDELENWRYARG